MFTEKIITSVLLFTIMYLVYVVWFKRLTFYNLNRWYLLLIAPLCAAIPFLKADSTTSGLVRIELDSFTVNPEKHSSALSPEKVFTDVFMLVYFTGLAIAAILFLTRCIILLVRIKKLKSISTFNDGYYLLPENVSPTAFTFMQTVFIHPSLLNPFVIQHELTHAKQKHSIDLLFYEIICCIFWMSPAHYFAKSSLLKTHEFIADRAAAADQQHAYSRQIIQLSLQSGSLPLSHQFNYKSLKTRIIMLSKKPSSSFSRLGYFLIIPVAATGLFFQSFSIAVTAPKNEIKNVTVPEEVKQPEFKGGTEALIKYLTQTLVYPEEAKNKQMKGKVFVEFVVSEKGKIKKVKIKKSDNDIFNAEALRVIKNMPDWIPGEKNGKPVATEMILPIQFALN